MYAFHYRRPRDAAEAVRWLAEDPDALPLGGGMTLLPTMKQRLAAPSALIDVGRLPDLRGIALRDGRLRIGAATLHAEVAASDEVRAALPGLAGLAAGIGDQLVRNRGTIGGSIANNDPAADYPAGALALDATVHTDRRELAAADFFAGLFSTALEPGEIVTALSFALPAQAHYEKLRNQASRYATCGVFVARWPDGRVSVAVTGAGNDGVFRFDALERALTDRFAPDAIAGIVPDESAMLADRTADGRFRAHLVNVVSRRAVHAMCAEHAAA